MINIRFVKWIGFAAFFMLINISKAQDIPQNFCLSTEEAQLFRLINEWRTAKGLDPLILSKSLSYVAQLHVKDLQMNEPYGYDCNHHSWSDKGNWTPFCYPKDQSRKKSVWNKPKELTRYPSTAYEVVYYENSAAFSDQIIENWKTTTQSANLILSEGLWHKNKWKVVGVAIFKGFASAWFGEATDPESDIRICHTDSVIAFTPSLSHGSNVQEGSGPVTESVIKKKNGRFYIISGSFNNARQAQDALSRVKKMGYKNAKVVENDGKFRVSIDDFGSIESAKAGRKKIASQFRDAWILNF